MSDRSQTKTPAPAPRCFFLLAGHERRRFFHFLFHEFTRLHLENWITSLPPPFRKEWVYSLTLKGQFYSCLIHVLSVFPVLLVVHLLSTYKSDGCVKVFVLQQFVRLHITYNIHNTPSFAFYLAVSCIAALVFRFYSAFSSVVKQSLRAGYTNNNYM